jgi:uncharacterized membrane protein YphA (DoxX/SURF4 family)
MSRSKLSIVLWIVQSVLALVFLFAGSMKLLAPAEMMEAQSPLPLALIRFIGMCEVAGALGLILPGLLRIRTALTPLAAACLVVLMLCATVLTPILIGTDVVMIMVPFIVGALAAFVAYGRGRVAPLRQSSPRFVARFAH